MLNYQIFLGCRQRPGQHRLQDRITGTLRGCCQVRRSIEARSIIDSLTLVSLAHRNSSESTALSLEYHG